MTDDVVALCKAVDRLQAAYDRRCAELLDGIAEVDRERGLTPEDIRDPNGRSILLDALTALVNARTALAGAIARPTATPSTPRPDAPMSLILKAISDWRTERRARKSYYWDDEIEVALTTEFREALFRSLGIDIEASPFCPGETVFGLTVAVDDTLSDPGVTVRFRPGRRAWG